LILLLSTPQVHAADDELGMAAQLGPKSWASCARFLSQPQAKVYELSQLRSPTMPLSPFAGPYQMRPKPTASIPGTTHAFNSETFNENAEPGQQGTQIDALGHFAVRGQPWDGKSPIDGEKITYYGGLPQSEVKPTPDSPLLKLGIEKIPPLITSAVLLDARALVGRGTAMAAGMLVTAKDIQAMLKAQGLEKRGIRAGDIVYVHTGWGERWEDPDKDKTYYAMAPGLSYDAARYLAGRKIVAVGLDAPFIDTVPEGMLAGKAPPAAGTPPGMPFAVHHHMLTQAGMHLIENAKLDEMARDKVWLSCTIVLPLREKGAAGSAIRPVAIGAAGKS
jgi:kynurenine formamidase